MKTLLTVFIQIITLSCAWAQVHHFNINAETLEAGKAAPKGWYFGFNDSQRMAYNIGLDTQFKQSGTHSLKIEKKSDGSSFAAIDYPLNHTFEGRKIQLKGFLKTENVAEGFAGLWMRIDGSEGVIAFGNMESRGVRGSTDWKEYVIDLPYDSEKAKVIHIGGLLAGSGKAWFDNFSLLIDNKPINEVNFKKVIQKKADLDTAFSSSSGIYKIDLSPQQIIHLALAGQFWAFLKYHHPAIANGDYNWDAELFRFLPQVIKAKTNAELSDVLEAYLDRLPAFEKIKPATPSGKVVIKPDYGRLFDTSLCSGSLISKLSEIKDHPAPIPNYYIALTRNVGNPEFSHEKPYSTMTYPDAGYRLLSLYRYWAMINYFFPYKDLIGEDWDKALDRAIPEYLLATNAMEYQLAVLRLISSIHDTHANIWGNYAPLNEFKGKYKLPLEAEFIEDQLVITGYISDTLEVKKQFKPGDVISGINGVKTEDLVHKYLPYTAASNYETQLRDLPRQFLLRDSTETFNLTIVRDGKTYDRSVRGLDAYFYPRPTASADLKSYKLLSPEIGYVYPGRYKNAELPFMQKMFRNTKGIVVDMRCYPSEFMPFTFGNYIKSFSGPFVRFSYVSAVQPGLFMLSNPLNNGDPKGEHYKGKIVVIVNATSQSQAEYTTMAFQSAPNVKVIGSTTAGADGNVSKIVLPGGINTMISGLGIFYPDGTPTQRRGVKIDLVVKPSICGVAEGKDELLEKAVKLLKGKDDETTSF